MIDVYFNGKKITDLIFANVKYGVMPEVDITSKQVANSNGIRVTKRRYKEYYVEVEFALRGEIEESKRKLAQLLDVEEPSILTTTKEPNLYWNAMVDGKIDWETIEKTGLGKINFLVPDGLAHSIVPSTINAQAGIIDIENEGTYPSKPIIEATMNSDNGFLAFINQEGALIQVGTPTEADGEIYQDSELLINDKMDGTQTGWQLNVANLQPWAAPLTQSGTVESFVIGSVGATRPATYVNNTGWNGPSLTKVIPADTNGHLGAKNFTFEFQNVLEYGSLADLDMCQFAVSDATGKVIVDLSFFKKSNGNTDGAVRLHVNAGDTQRIAYIPNLNNAYTGRNRGISSITKFGAEITLQTGGKTYKFRDLAIENLEATKISWYAARWQNRVSGSVNCVKKISFKKHNVDMWRNIPNKFAAGDIVKIDTRNQKIYKNNVLANELGTLGNNWDSFSIKPGTNKITCMHSDFATEPAIALEYEECYL